MTDIKILKEKIKSGELNEKLGLLYSNDEDKLIFAQKRYIEALDRFEKLFPDKKEVEIFSAPGRTEICGNHTDHNNGKTLAAAIHLDVIAVVSKNENKIEVHSEGFSPDVVNLSDMDYCESEKNTSKALIKGVCSALNQYGFKFGGFSAYTTSNVLKGSGVSSSAAFEVVIATILNHLYNEGKIDAVTLAKASQYAENKFFGKPCGLLDQTASSYGGFITIDFADSKNPEIEKIDYSLENSGFTLCIVDVGANHADLTDEYASIPNEMKSVAAFFGKETLRGICRADILENAKTLKESCGDRAVLRALHFADENDRVEKAAAALSDGDIAGFLKQIRRSGRSSFMYLQNVYSSLNVKEQSLSLALCLTDGIIGTDGAFRVHGGGFGGTIQAFVPNKKVSEYKNAMDSVFGENACTVLSVRAKGGVKVLG